MNLAAITLVLAIGWAAATGSFSLLNLLFGGVVGMLCLYLVRDHVGGAVFGPRAKRIIVLAFTFLKELVVSASRVAVLVCRPDLNKRIQPAIIAFPLTAKGDGEITLLANMITLTPGTLSVDVSEDRRFLYIHAMDVKDKDAMIAEIRDGFERQVVEAFK